MNLETKIFIFTSTNNGHMEKNDQKMPNSDNTPYNRGNEGPSKTVPQPSESGEETKGISAEKQEENTKKIEKIEKDEKTIKKEENIKSRTPKDFFHLLNWSANPFTLSIEPELFVGYEDEKSEIIRALEERHKLSLVLGPTGSGKTTLLKWIDFNLHDNYDMLYLGKPPDKPEGFIDIFNDHFKPNLFLRILRLFIPHIRNLNSVPGFLNKKLREKKMVILLDEAHESQKVVLEWLRVLSDQVNNLFIVISALPVFEENLSELETFRKRIMARIELLSLTKEETTELIKRRIEKVGGSFPGPFDENLINLIYERTGGFPREVIRMCNELMNKAILDGKEKISPDMFEEKREKPSLGLLEKMTPMKRKILELLIKPMTPGQLADSLNLEKYKTRQHAVRSVNNILKELMEEETVERRKTEKTFVYQLAPSVRTLVVKA
jgi:type II secretory pathway predicted ATPase ExeA